MQKSKLAKWKGAGKGKEKGKKSNLIVTVGATSAAVAVEPVAPSMGSIGSGRPPSSTVYAGGTSAAAASNFTASGPKWPKPAESAASTRAGAGAGAGAMVAAAVTGGAQMKKQPGILHIARSAPKASPKSKAAPKPKAAPSAPGAYPSFGSEGINLKGELELDVDLFLSLASAFPSLVATARIPTQAPHASAAPAWRTQTGVHTAVRNGGTAGEGGRTSKTNSKKKKKKPTLDSMLADVGSSNGSGGGGGKGPGKGKGKPAKPISFSFGGGRKGPASKEDDGPSAFKAGGRKGAAAKVAAAPRNALDSTAPVVRRGKERETPKKKRLSHMKRIILREREHKLLTAGCVWDQAAKPSKDNQPPQGYVRPEPVIEYGAARLRRFQQMIHAFLIDFGVVCEDNGASVDGAGGRGASHVDGGGERGSADTGSGMGIVGDEDDDDDNVDEISDQDGPDSQASLRLDFEERTQLMERFPSINTSGHSRRFREYCNQRINPEMNATMKEFLVKLSMFQRRAYELNPMKATKLKRRLVVGFREVLKYIRLGKIKCVIIAPDIERIQAKGGLDQQLAEILQLCKEQQVPPLFGLRRRKLGLAMKKKVQISIIGILNYQGANEMFKELLEQAEIGCAEYAASVAPAE